ncbi:hypothetical protein [Marinimicrobium sp. C2-29]|uniref:hypothetical protein n=1 Tax=Marinimicrobium sp. C2-29 TaxID=3139825 RepID=UPI00313954E2
MIKNSEGKIMGSKNCILITGILRNAFLNENIFKEISKRYDVFVVTSTDSAEDVKYLGRVKNVYYVEDDPLQLKIQNDLLQLREGFKYLQWQKLLLGYFLIDEWKNKNHVEYNKVIKLRTDLSFDSVENALERLVSIVEDDVCLNKEKCIAMNTDLYFSFDYKFFDIVSAFFIASLSNYYASFSFQSFKGCRSFHEMDFSAAKFLWLKLPRVVVGNLFKEADVYNALLKHDDQLKGFNGQSEVSCIRSNYKHILFPSEVAFLHYLLVSGFVVKSFKHRFSLSSLRNLSKKDIQALQFCKNNLHDEKVLQSFLSSVDFSLLPDDQADFFRDTSITAEHSGTIKVAYLLMKIANKIRPHGPYILEKLSEYQKRLDCEKDCN